MFMSGFRESYSQTASFEEDDPTTFSLFAEWLYTDALSPTPRCAVLSGPMDRDIEYIKLYAFAEKICEDRLANVAMTSLRSWYKYTHTRPDLDAMSLAYEVTMPRSPLRRLMVEVLAWDVVFSSGSSSETWCRPGKVFCPLLWNVLERCEDLAVDFIVLLLQVARARGESEGEGGSERWGMGNPLERGHCLYHVYGKGEELCAYSEDNVDGGR